MEFVLKTAVIALTARLADSFFRHIKDETAPFFFDHVMERLKKSAIVLGVKAGFSVLSAAGFLMFYAEAMRQLDEQGLLYGNARLFGSVGLFAFFGSLLFIPMDGGKEAKEAQEKTAKAPPEPAEPLNFEKPAVLPSLAPGHPTAGEVLLQELRREREAFALRRQERKASRV